MQLEQRARAAAEETGRQRAAFDQGARDLERFQRQLAEAEQMLLALRSQLNERQELLVRLQRGVESAELIERAARAEAERARAMSR